MSVLASKERAVDGIRASIIERCNDAHGKVSGQRPSAEDIHSARRSLKKARGWLRLLEAGLSRKSFRQHNHTLRDAARPLSEGRDAQILVSTLKELLERSPKPSSNRRFGKFKLALEKERASIQRRLIRPAGEIAQSRRLVRRSVAALRGLRIRGEDWDVIGASFEKVYASGRKCLRAARQSPTSERLHEWRKDTKYLWYDLQILEPLRPGLMVEWARQAHRLSECLGDDHDLAVLRETAEEKSTTFSNSTDLEALMTLVDRRRKKLQKKAFLLGARVYESKPKPLRARMRKYWKSWAKADHWAEGLA